MSRSELHNWECDIESLCGDNADKILAIAQDIYNTAYVRGKNYMSFEKEDILSKIRAEISAILTNSYDEGVKEKALQIIDKYKSKSPDTEKLKPCINYEDGCEEWAGCPCVYYKAESEV